MHPWPGVRLKNHWVVSSTICMPSLYGHAHWWVHGVPGSEMFLTVSVWFLRIADGVGINPSQSAGTKIALSTGILVWDVWLIGPTARRLHIWIQKSKSHMYMLKRIKFVFDVSAEMKYKVGRISSGIRYFYTHPECALIQAWSFMSRDMNY